ncbi:MAG: hypothetical protein U0350_40685 [Caldilineaceae bacterium]
MEKQRCNLMLDSDVVEMLDELSGSERKRGLWISNMIRTAYAAQRSNVDIRTMDIEGLRLTVLGLAGRVQTVEGEMLRTQSQLAAMIANSGQ